MLHPCTSYHASAAPGERGVVACDVTDSAAGSLPTVTFFRFGKKTGAIVKKIKKSLEKRCYYMNGEYYIFCVVIIHITLSRENAQKMWSKKRSAQISGSKSCQSKNRSVAKKCSNYNHGQENTGV